MNNKQPSKSMPSCCAVPQQKRRIDWLLWGSITIIFLAYGWELLVRQNIISGDGATIKYLSSFSASVFDLLNTMAWGILVGLLFVGILGKIPREYVMTILGKGGTFTGILRATGAGVLLDLCSHGILMVGMKLYERGASLGQVMAFLIASPWNSFSLTLILWALVGFWWMIAFLLLSLVIAVISGLIFEFFVKMKVLPKNPNQSSLPKNFSFWKDGWRQLKKTKYNGSFFKSIAIEGMRGSQMVLRWVFFGIILASLLRTFVPMESFQTLFGPTILGLGMTLLVATILEVCSEGSTPIAADILTRAGAPGNAFGFLMTGVATDYTEIMALKDTTKSWKISLFLPLVTVPQVVALALLLNYFGAAQ